MAVESAKFQFPEDRTGLSKTDHDDGLTFCSQIYNIGRLRVTLTIKYIYL